MKLVVVFQQKFANLRNGSLANRVLHIYLLHNLFKVKMKNNGRPSFSGIVIFFYFNRIILDKNWDYLISFFIEKREKIWNKDKNERQSDQFSLIIIIRWWWVTFKLMRLFVGSLSQVDICLCRTNYGQRVFHKWRHANWKFHDWPSTTSSNFLVLRL